MPPINARNPRSLVLLAADQITSEGLQWIEVMPTVEKARNGRWYFTVTTEDLETFAQSIRDQPGLIPIDYDHQGVEGSSRAAGWFTGQARVEGDRLLAEVQWTPKAVGEIQAGEYKRISPEFSFQDKDQKTGLMTRAKELLAATLTNRPFFRELAPIGADVVWAPGQGFEQLRQKLHAALNPGPIDSARYWVMDISMGSALVQEYQSHRTWVVPFAVDQDGDVAPAGSTEWQEAQQEWVAATVEAARQNTGRRPFRQKENEMDTSVIAKTLGLAEDATDEQIEQAVKANAEKTAELERENTELKAAVSDEDRVEKLEQQLATERARRVVGEREQLLAQAVRENRIVPAQKDALVTAFGGDSPTDEHVVALRAFVDGSPARSAGEVGSGGPGEQDPDTETAAKQFQTADNVPVDDDTVRTHVLAEALLRQDGHGDTYTSAQYMRAVERVQAGEQPKVTA